MCSHCNGGNYDMELQTHEFVGVQLREKELIYTGYAQRSVEFRVWVCSCGEEFRDMRDLREHLGEVRQ